MPAGFEWVDGKIQPIGYVAPAPARDTRVHTSPEPGSAAPTQFPGFEERTFRPAPEPGSAAPTQFPGFEERTFTDRDTRASQGPQIPEDYTGIFKVDGQEVTREVYQQAAADLQTINISLSQADPQMTTAEARAFFTDPNFDDAAFDREMEFRRATGFDPVQAATQAGIGDIWGEAKPLLYIFLGVLGLGAISKIVR